MSQSTIKMDKGYYEHTTFPSFIAKKVAIHNKNGQGLLPMKSTTIINSAESRNPQ